MYLFPLRTYCMVFGYDGTDYHGMQIQMKSNKKIENLKTIESEMEECFRKLDIFYVDNMNEDNFLKQIKWSRVGRTDKGVHSICQVVSFRTKIKVDEDLISILKSEDSEITKLKELLLEERNYMNISDNKSFNTKVGNPLLCVKNNIMESFNNFENQFMEELFILNYIVDELNKILTNKGIQVFKIIRVTKNFDARIDCSRRQYEYIMPEYLLLPVSINDQDLEKELLDVCDKQYTQGVKEIASLKKRKRNTYRKDENQDEIESLDEKNQKIKDFEFHQINRLNNYGFGDNFKLVNYNIEHYIDKNKHFKLSEQQLNEFQLILNQYIGTHSFHNFTSKLNYSDSSSWRHIEEIIVERINNSDIENSNNNNINLIKIIIKGQSFLLHQIRKMIALSIEVFRGTAPKNAIKLCFLPNKLFIHLAPSQGLLLDRVFYDTYNIKRNISSDQNSFAINSLSFHDKRCEFVKNMENFKKNKIYQRICKYIFDDQDNK